MAKFWKSKKFWLSLLALIGIGAFIYYFFFLEGNSLNREIEEEKEEQYKEDVTPPATKIYESKFNIGHNKNFQIQTIDEDTGSGLDEDSCQYIVFALGDNHEEFSSGWRRRECNDFQTITVGPEGDCRFEGEDSCLVLIRCRDKAGNWSSYARKKYYIDFTKPTISQSEIIEKDTEYNLKIKASDNIEVRECLLYVDGEKQGSMNFLDTNCNNDCFLEKDFIVSGPGTHSVYVYCRDYLGNWGRGEKIEIKKNSPPEINYCRVSLTSGDKKTEISFGVSASDVDKDELFFTWHFGNNQTSTEENPTYKYSESGLYKPWVEVSDGKENTTCSTAWVTIEE